MIIALYSFFRFPHKSVTLFVMATAGKRKTFDHPEDQPKILLAVTGSVAAIKCPELAVRLVRDLGASVKVLLTAGGKNFWEKAEGYSQENWNWMMEEVEYGAISIIRKF
jgi:phosphopantothenoylcysteine synthetase/decarboxylase